MLKHYIWCILFFWSSSTYSQTIYQTPEDFIAKNLLSNYLKQSIGLNKTQKEIVKKILNVSYSPSRYFFWQDTDKKRAWIVSHVAKNKPFTTGFIIVNKKVIFSKVLIYREHHGEEITKEFFLNQFIDINLTTDLELSKHIDGISGATYLYLQ